MGVNGSSPLLISRLSAPGALTLAFQRPTSSGLVCSGLVPCAQRSRWGGRSQQSKVARPGCFRNAGLVTTVKQQVDI